MMFSKRKGLAVFGNDVKDTKIHGKLWYLLPNKPQVSSLFSISGWLWMCDHLVRIFNRFIFVRHLIYMGRFASKAKYLVNNLGNFMIPVLSFITKAHG